MILRKGFPILLAVLMVLTVLLLATGCGGGTEETSTTSSVTNSTTTSQTTGTPSVGGDTDSTITGTLYMALQYDVSGIGADSQALNQWEVTVRIATSTDVPGFTNPTKDWVNKQLIAKTDVDMSSFNQGDAITANVKAVTDDPKYQFYMYNISKK